MHYIVFHVIVEDLFSCSLYKIASLLTWPNLGRALAVTKMIYILFIFPLRMIKYFELSLISLLTIKHFRRVHYHLKSGTVEAPEATKQTQFIALLSLHSTLGNRCFLRGNRLLSWTKHVLLCSFILFFFIIELSVTLVFITLIHTCSIWNESLWGYYFALSNSLLAFVSPVFHL